MANSMASRDGQVSIEAAKALAQHLRVNPNSSTRSASELATEFGLPQEFVETLLRAPEAPPAPRRSMGESIGELRHHVAPLERIWAELMRKPLPFLWVTSVLFVLMPFVVGNVITPRQNGRLTVVAIAVAFVFVAGLTLQAACAYTKGMVRYALYAGLINWLVTTVAGICALWWGSRASPDTEIWLSQLLLALALLLLWSFLTAIPLLMAVFGGYAALRREEKTEIGLSRQELLDRLFQLQERIGRADATSVTSGGLFSIPWIRRAREHWLPIVLAGGLTYGLVYAVALKVVYTGVPRLANIESVAQSFVVILSAIFSVLMGLAAGFLPGGVLRGIGAVALFSIASTVGPVGLFGMQYLTVNYAAEGTLIARVAFDLFEGLIGGLGSRIEAHASAKRLLHENDPSTLLAEMVRIQRKLGSRLRAVCVMVVDAAKSSLMKEGSDPFEVEWTFRRYQQFIEAISARTQGEVYSTAGDGAVVAFPGSKQAFDAARAIQTEIDGFNRDVNRLSLPFRLRIGLHCGEITASLDEVEYTAVIDIAAHIEASAPVGGIAMSEKVAQDLGEERLAELKTEVDGYAVYLALDPTHHA